MVAALPVRTQQARKARDHRLQPRVMGVVTQVPQADSPWGTRLHQTGDFADQIHNAL